MPRGIPNSKALHNPVVSTGQISTDEFQPGQDHDRILRTTGPAEKALDEAIIEPVNAGREWQEHADQLAFMNELVDVILAPSSDDNAEHFVMVGVNGRTQYFERGKHQTVRRMYLEQLARARITKYKQTEITDSEGYRQIVNRPVTSMAYPFTVVRDANPKGVDWLKRVMAEA